MKKIMYPRANENNTSNSNNNNNKCLRAYGMQIGPNTKYIEI